MPAVLDRHVAQCEAQYPADDRQYRVGIVPVSVPGARRAASVLRELRPHLSPEYPV